MPYFTALQFIGKTARQQPTRPLAVVERDFFRKRINLSWLTRRYLANMPLGQYVQVIELIDRLRSFGEKFGQLRLDPPRCYAEMNFSALPDNFLLERIDGFTLNLKNLRTEYNKYVKRPNVQIEAGRVLVVEQRPIHLTAVTTADSDGRPVPSRDSIAQAKGLVDTGRPFIADRFLTPKMSRTVSFKSYGQQVTGEIIDEPLKTAGHLLGTQFALINEVGVDTWGHFPSKFARERLMDVSKAVFLRINGELAGYTAAKAVFVGGKKAQWFEIALTKQKFQKMHLQTRSFYWLLKEAYLEQVARFIASRGRFAWLNYLLALPALIKAALYAIGWVKNPPPEIAAIKVPVAYLAVQPASFGPILEYVADVFPNPYRPEIKPDQEKLEIARAVIPAGARLNETNFVIEGDYEGIEHLIVDPDKKPGEGGVLRYKDERVNRWMAENLRFEEKAGRDQLVVMNLTLADFRRYFERLRLLQLEKKTVARVLNATRDL